MQWIQTVNIAALRIFQILDFTPFYMQAPFGELKGKLIEFAKCFWNQHGCLVSAVFWRLENCLIVFAVSNEAFVIHLNEKIFFRGRSVAIH